MWENFRHVSYSNVRQMSTVSVSFSETLGCNVKTTTAQLKARHNNVRFDCGIGDVNRGIKPGLLKILRQNIKENKAFTAKQTHTHKNNNKIAYSKIISLGCVVGGSIIPSNRFLEATICVMRTRWLMFW